MSARMCEILAVLWITFLLLSCNVRAGNSDEVMVPEFEGLRECPQGSDDLLNECLKLVAEDFRPYLRSGLPQLGLGRLDPIHVHEFEITIAPNLRYTWKNVEIRGFSKYSKLELEVNTTRRTVVYRIACPALHITADYIRTGRFLFLQLDGAGVVQLDIMNYRENRTFFLDIVPNGRRGPTVKVKDMAYESSVDDIQSHVANLAEAGFWGTLMNNFLNVNAKWIFEEFIQPQLKAHEIRDRESHSRAIANLIPAVYFINNN